MKLCFIGGGNMASALIGGLIGKGQAATDISVIEPVAAQREHLTKAFDVRCFEAVSRDALAGDVIVFAVKPQQMRAVAQILQPLLTGQLVISIAAGIRAVDLSRWLGGHRRIVRTMPNTPALIAKGITGVAAMAGLSAADRATTATILQAVGDCVWVDREEQLDAVTAVSGSGPAYVFYFMEAMISGGQALGLTEEQARRLTLATFAGAAQLALNSSEAPSVLRERVTSKGGTTAAALATFAHGKVAAQIELGLAAADRRSMELGDEFGKD